jgi:redox-sensitive bicupin YhaK (pirin superfamily)
MVQKIAKEAMFNAQQGWLNSRFHFSFAQYHDPKNVQFGALRVLNDDIIAPQSGFDMHPHRDMEIVTYIIEGELTHQDSMGHRETLGRGEVQYMSAGTGVYHLEHNMHPSWPLRLLQMWILPPTKGLEPSYGSHRYTQEERSNTLLNIVSPQNGDAPIKLYQDVNFYVSELDEGQSVEYDFWKDRQIYFVQIEGSSDINGTITHYGDALKIMNEELLLIKALEASHFLFITMLKG